jgi:hypothetical protein
MKKIFQKVKKTDVYYMHMQNKLQSAEGKNKIKYLEYNVNQWLVPFSLGGLHNCIITTKDREYFGYLAVWLIKFGCNRVWFLCTYA